jgi:hypothetical protein
MKLTNCVVSSEETFSMKKLFVSDTAYQENSDITIFLYKENVNINLSIINSDLA